MLVISRREGQSLMIGDSIEIMTLSIQKNKVNMGIRAPKEIAVHRIEIYRKIQKKSNETPEDSDQ